MPKRLYKPSVEKLELLRSGATQNGKVSESEWVKKCCVETARILRKDPLRYRSYGPYWWVQKRAMIDNDINDFGDFVDQEWHDLVDYGNNFLNLLAALIYSNSAMDMGLIYSNSHNIALLQEDGMEQDIQVYQIIDEEVELYSHEKGLGSV